MADGQVAVAGQPRDGAFRRRSAEPLRISEDFRGLSRSFMPMSGGSRQAAGLRLRVKIHDDLTVLRLDRIVLVVGWSGPSARSLATSVVSGSGIARPRSPADS